jgi:hypothetical protein
MASKSFLNEPYPAKSLYTPSREATSRKLLKGESRLCISENPHHLHGVRFSRARCNTAHTLSSFRNLELLERAADTHMATKKICMDLCP